MAIAISSHAQNTNQATMSSREIAELTGKRHDHVLRDVEKMLRELGQTSPLFWGEAPDSYNRPQRVAFLPKDLTFTLVAGYNVRMRHTIVKRWQELEAERGQQLATIKDPQLAAMVTMLTQLDAVKQEQQAQRLELEDLRAKVTATPDQYYTVAGYASLRGLSIDTVKANLLGRKAAKLSREYGLEISKAHSAIYGAVNTYHVDVLCQVFADIK